MLRLFNHYLSGRKLALFLAESATIAAGCVAGAISLIIAMAPAHADGIQYARVWFTGLIVQAVFLAMALQAVLYAQDLYDLRVAAEDRQTGVRVVRGGGLVALAFGFGLLALRVRAPMGAIYGGAGGALLGALAARGAWNALVGEPHRVLILGTGLKALALSREIQQQGDDLVQVVGLAEVRKETEASIPALARRVRANAVVLALDEGQGVASLEQIVRCRFAGIPVYEPASYCERVLRRLPLTHLKASYLCFSDGCVISSTRRAVKRAFDIAVASVGALLALPIGLLVTLAIKLDSKGPIFYRQERVGEGGRTFRLWKFRSMRSDAEKNGAVWARVNDDRVTRVGRFIRKTRLDEIPQLLNVLNGDMSFVGPRPERPVFVEMLKEQIPFYGLREAVKPGITGWAQIRYPYGASVEDAKNKLELDLYYVKNGSLFLDLSVIFHTVRHVLTGRGAR